MAPMHFDDLPLDLKKSIISYIVRPLDLKTLCLTSKAFRELATPPLYYKVTLFIGGPKDVLISGMLSRTNPGVQYIRKLYLQLERIPKSRDSDDEDSGSSSDEEDGPQYEDSKIPARHAQFTVRLLIDFLPNDILEVFSWQNWEPFSIDNWVLLCKNQRRMKAVEIAAVDRPFLPVLEKHPELLKNLTEVNSLHFYPESLDRLSACQKALEARPEVREMQLSPAPQFGPGQPPTDLHDTSVRPGLIFRTIFSHLMPLDNCTPIRLKKLTLDNIDVRYAADTYMRAIDFSCLESLVVGGCPGADALWAQMSKPHIRPNRMKKIRWFHEIAAEPHALEAFEGLLEGLLGLEIIHVDLKHIGGLPKPSVITHHAKTLRVLALQSRTRDDGPFNKLSYYTQEQFNEITTECTEIRQLSIATPETDVSQCRPSPEFTLFLRCAAKLRHLVTLNIQRWPRTQNHFISDYEKLKPRAFDFYQHNLQRLAQQIFEASDIHSKEQDWKLPDRSNLRVIAFGGNGSTSYDESKSYKIKQMPFVRGTKSDPLGRQEMLAVRITWKQVAWVEGESDVLNHSMYDLEDVHHTP